MWYFEEAGQTVGPMPEADIRAAIATGRIQRTTLVWRDGMGGWVAAAQTELAAAFPPPPGTLPAPTPAITPAIVPALAPAPPAYAPPPYAAPAYPQPGRPMLDYSGQGQHFAGFWIRLAAYVIDAIFAQIGAYILGAIVGLVMAQAVIITDQSMELTNVQLAGGAVGFVWAIVYYLVPMAGNWQATPGKRLLGLRVIRIDGQRIGYGLALGRWLSYILSSIIMGFGFFMIGWTEQKRALHDMICSTRVIYARA